MLNVYTVAFFGHRVVDNGLYALEKIENVVLQLISEKEYVEFLVGRNGEFDILAASAVRKIKKTHCNNSELTWVLPYPVAEYENNAENFNNFYDRVEICDKSQISHYKSAIKIRNHEMVRRADLVIAYIEREYGGAYQAVKYAQKLGKKIINVADQNSLVTLHTDI